MRKILSHPAIYAILYLMFMAPTYLLPYLGSNSTFINAAAMSVGVWVNPWLSVHLAALLMLITLSWIRGSEIGKEWLVIFPILASLFDLLPGMNVVPFVPTVMHLLAIILGVVGNSSAQISAHHMSVSRAP